MLQWRQRHYRKQLSLLTAGLLVLLASDKPIKMPFGSEGRSPYRGSAGFPRDEHSYYCSALSCRTTLDL